MARPKLKKDKKRVSLSFTLPPEYHDILLEKIPPGERSSWICKVVTSSLIEFKEVGINKLG